MVFEDYLIDDITSKTPKKINSGKKGKRGELEISHILNKRFDKILSSNPDWGKFSRSLGSGNRLTQKVILPKHATDTFAGDLVCPGGGFKFVIESKNGYNHIELCGIFDNQCKELDAFLQQVLTDSKKCNRCPLLLWKKDRKPIVAFLKTEDIKDQIERFDSYLLYGTWTAVSFNKLLTLQDGFFFSEVALT